MKVTVRFKKVLKEGFEWDIEEDRIEMWVKAAEKEAQNMNSLLEKIKQDKSYAREETKLFGRNIRERLEDSMHRVSAFGRFFSSLYIGSDGIVRELVNPDPELLHGPSKIVFDKFLDIYSLIQKISRMFMSYDKNENRIFELLIACSKELATIAKEVRATFLGGHTR